MSTSQSSYTTRVYGSWDEWVCRSSDSGPPQCDRHMRSILLPIGAGIFDHCAPGFEYCLDAPIRFPAGSHVCIGVQPITD